jgi:hypothetical protein
VRSGIKRRRTRPRLRRNGHGRWGRRATVRLVRRTWFRVRRAFPALFLALLAVLPGGCTRTVIGTPVAVPPVAPTTVPDSVGAGASTERPPAPTAGVEATSPSGRTPAPGMLQPDVLADECLLDTAQMTALLGSPMRPPEQSMIQRDDGSRGSSCFTGPAGGAAGPMAAVNVYRVRTGTPAQFVRAAGGRPLRGVTATVLDTAAGPTLQVGGARFLVTVAVQGREPDDAAWRAAARAVLARLPR